MEAGLRLELGWRLRPERSPGKKLFSKLNSKPNAMSSPVPSLTEPRPSRSRMAGDGNIGVWTV